MTSILHQQAQGRNRENAARRRASTHAPAGVPVPGRGAARAPLGSASPTPWNRTGTPQLQIHSASVTPRCSGEHQAQTTNPASPYATNGPHSDDRALARPEVALQAFASADSQDGCEEGCHYCNGPETD